MPLLSELREFKASFANVGGQKANLAAKKIPINDLKLPETEAEPMVEPEPMAEPAASDAGGGGIDGLDFSDFINALPGDLSVPDITEPATETEPNPPADDKAGEDDTYPPDELLSDLPNKLEPVPPTDSLESDSGSSLDNLNNLDNLEKFNFPDPPAEPAPVNTSAPADASAQADAFVQADEDSALDLSVFDDLGDFANLTASSSEGEPSDLSDSSLPEEPAASGEGETPDFSSLDLPEEPAAVSEDETPDFSSLDLPEEPAAASESETSEPATISEGETPDFSGFDFPEEPAASSEGETPDLDDLATLDDFDMPGEPAAASEVETSDLDDLDALGDFDMPGEPTAASESEPPDLDALGDFDMPGEPAAASESEPPDLDALGDFDLPEAPVAASEDETFNDLGDSDLPKAPSADDDGPEIGELDGLDTPTPSTFDDFDLPEEPAAGETPEAGDQDSLDLPEEPEAAIEDETTGIDLGDLDAQISADGLADTPSDDAFEGFDPISGLGLEKDTDDDSGENIDSFDDIDDMSFPDLDIGESQIDKKPAAAGKAVRKKGKRRGEIPIPEKEDDIELNNSELRYLQGTLAAYPLNLRIACEEIIAEQSVRPEQMVRLIRNLIRGAPARETAVLASEILDRPITVPRGFEKSSVEALEAEKSTFAYIFFHNFLPILRLITLIAIVAGSIFYLTYKFVYVPLVAESIYRKGYERIPEGEYERANERFSEAFKKHRKKDWFYKYADAFIKERQYIYAEQKYEELLRYYPRDKVGVLSYAHLETKYLRNYAKADALLRHNILDYNPDDPEALLALGDNSLAWGEIDPSKYEDARFSYARLIDILGQQPFLMERMMKYFIRTDNLKEVLPIWQWFDYDPVKRPLGAETLSELGGYLLDKQLEEVRGVPNEYVALIDGVRDILLRAVRQDPSLPEPHYHLARYYKNLGNDHEERVTLEIAIREFEKAEEGSLRRMTYRIDTYQRYADNLINSREFMHAEEQLQKGINLYEDAMSRRLLSSSPQYGRLYAGLGDLEYFVKTGDMEAALRYYNLAQQNGWAPPDMQYRMGAAHYQLGNWQAALENFFAASSKLPQNRRILFALGNSALKRGDSFAAQGYYNRLLDMLENQRSRLPLLLPNDRPEYLDLAERLMMARNNAGVANEMLAARTGSRTYQSRAMSLYSESQRAWDSLTRDPGSMVRSSSTSLPYLNMRNMLYPRQNYEPQMFMRIDREASESSRWEQLAPAFRD
jgi:tetratricopeptide (TPR) repeat protein